MNACVEDMQAAISTALEAQQVLLQPSSHLAAAWGLCQSSNLIVAKQGSLPSCHHSLVVKHEWIELELLPALAQLRL